MMLSVASLCTQLEDVNNAYSHDEIRFDGKHEELLTKFQTERTQDKTKYEVKQNMRYISIVIIIVRDF